MNLRTGGGVQKPENFAVVLNGGPQRSHVQMKQWEGGGDCQRMTNGREVA